MPLWLTIGLVMMVAGVSLFPATGAAQSCADCPVYARTELNLRQNPSLDAAVLRVVPAGAPLERRAGAEVNGYAPVAYDRVPGWVVALGVVSSPEEVDAAPGFTPAAVRPGANDARRLTLEPLYLRRGPSLDAEPLLVMPRGAMVTLTGEGAENGYVTVTYDGVPGWAHADFLSEEPAR